MSSTSSTLLDTTPPALRIALTNEKVTGPPAAAMLQRSGIFTSEPQIDVLDNACGAGVVTAELLRGLQQSSQPPKLGWMVSGDIDAKMLDFCQRKKDAALEQWRNVEIMEVDQKAIPFEDGRFTHVFSNFGVFFAPNDSIVLAETYRVLKSGGVAGFATWKTIAWWGEIALPALARYLPSAPALPDPGTLFPGRGWSDPGAVRTKLEAERFVEVDVSEFAFTPRVEARRFAEAMAALVLVVARRTWSSDEIEKLGAGVEEALRQYLEDDLGGKWEGTMTAIVSIGRKG